MDTLTSFLCGQWQAGAAPLTPIHAAATGEVIAQASSRGLDLGAALACARQHGGEALRSLTFAQRGERLGLLAQAVAAHRDELIDLSLRNMGTTRGDGKFDVDGASGTLAYYARLGAEWGDRRWLFDGDQVQFCRSKRFVGQHLWLPRRGVAIHINAFNFPTWNLSEKLACAWLAGVPVLAKPGTASAPVAHRLVSIWHAEGLIPPGALQLLCGGAGDLLDHVGPQDCIVFTGSGATAAQIKGHPAVLRHNVAVNVEADSLNAAVLGPDVAPGSDLWTMFLAEVAREMTQKAGQKCTAIRRIVVPRAVIAEVRAELTARLQDAAVGDPALSSTAVGPLAGPSQQRDVEAGIAALSATAELVWQAKGVPAAGCFAAPTLFQSELGAAAPFVHDHEIFGPCATLLPVDPAPATVAEVVAKGGGSLAASVFSDDAGWAREVILAIAPYTGRIYWGSAKVFDQGIGHGAVMPALVHGGPGKAGGGEELGGERGLRFYWQRVAVQGDTQLLRGLAG